MLYIVVVVLFTESAYKHGFQEEDFYEVLETGPVKLRSKRGLEGVYELYGRNYAGSTSTLLTVANQPVMSCFTCAR